MKKLTLLLTALCFGCQPKPPQPVTGPDVNVVLKFIQGQVPPYLTVQNLKTEAFIDPVSMQGRLSVAGEVLLNENLCSPISGEEFLTDNHIQQVDYDRFKQENLPALIRIVAGKGFKSAFNCEYNVRKTVDGWVLNGRPPKPQCEGRPQVEFNGAILTSDPAAQAAVAQVREKMLKERQAYNNLNKAVAEKFAEQSKYECTLTARDYGNDENVKPNFMLTIKEAPTPAFDRNVSGKPQASFKIPVKVEWNDQNIVHPPGIPADKNLRSPEVELLGETTCENDQPKYVLELVFYDTKADPSDRNRYSSRFKFVFDGEKFQPYASGYMNVKVNEK